MVTLLAKLFIRETEDKNKLRQAYGMLCSIVGIMLNVVLFAGKLIAGQISNSIAITADAVNNLSDAGSSIVTLIGFKLAGQKPDTEHPFGHGRMEYISGLIVSAAILLMGYELAKDSLDKILHPLETSFSSLVVLILVASICVKLYMFLYNSSVAKKIDSLVSDREREGYKAVILISEENKELYSSKNVITLGSKKRDETIAATLYAALRKCDELGADYIFSEAFSEGALSGAIMNRLLKAAGQRVIEV